MNAARILATATPTTLVLFAACATTPDREPRAVAAPAIDAITPAPIDVPPAAAAEPPLDVTLAQLGGRSYEGGLRGMPERLRQLDGKRIRINGTFHPIDSVDGPELLLMPEHEHDWDTHRIVRVTLPARQPNVVGRRVQLVGTLSIRETRVHDGFGPEGYCIDIYQLRADSCTDLGAAMTGAANR